MMCRNHLGQWSLAGVVSSGSSYCDTNEPNLMSRVTTYTQWIHQTMEELSGSICGVSYHLYKHSIIYLETWTLLYLDEVKRGTSRCTHHRQTSIFTSRIFYVGPHWDVNRKFDIQCYNVIIKLTEIWSS